MAGRVCGAKINFTQILALLKFMVTLFKNFSKRRAIIGVNIEKPGFLVVFIQCKNKRASPSGSSMPEKQ